MAALHDDEAHEAAATASSRATSPRDDDLYLLAYENVRTALARFEEKEIETLPVLEFAGRTGTWSAI